MKHHISSEALARLPDTPGVYLFYGSQRELLYVGKSKTVRTRVRSHFSTPEERRMCRMVFHVEVRETAGDLGALLLESQLIKELRPLLNVAARRRRRIIIARRSLNTQGYAIINLEAVDYLELRSAEPILGVFKHKTQAKEFLASVTKTHRLCAKLLRLEPARNYCFAYHLGQCSGACMGEEDAEAYNARVEAAFEARRIKAWPYDGGVAIEERTSDNLSREVFLIDNWCLVASYRESAGVSEPMVQQQHRFDYDSYKILYSYLTNPLHQSTIRILGFSEFEALRASKPGKPAPVA